MISAQLPDTHSALFTRLQPESHPAGSPAWLGSVAARHRPALILQIGARAIMLLASGVDLGDIEQASDGD